MATLAKANANPDPRDELVSKLSHDLRTPLNAILGWTEILRAGGVDEAIVARALEAIQRSARAQVQLLDDATDASRILSGELELDSRVVSLRDVAERAADSARPAATAAKIEIELTAPVQDGDDELAVEGDRDRLVHVVATLISRAMERTAPGGRVRVSAERVESGGRLVVEGSGPETAARGESSLASASVPVRDERRSALSMAIVRRIVEAHSGAVVVDECQGPGRPSRFVVTLATHAIALEDCATLHGARAPGEQRTDVEPG